MLYPLSYELNLHPHSLTDVSHSNVFVRDYDKEVFHRFRQNLKSNVIDVKGATIVVCHEDSIIRRFQSFYADVRDTSVRGECFILRMSSSDDVDSIMSKIDHKIAIITHKDHVEIKGLYVDSPDTWDSFEYPTVGAKDDIGAGDSFDVGFMDYVISNSYNLASIKEAIDRGIEVAQEKVTNIGVFM
jgi:sugar/nucleoside kinase (ribokinase family)